MSAAGSDTRCDGRSPRSPLSQRAPSTAAAKAVSRYGSAAAARQQAAQQKQPTSSRYGQHPQSQQQRQPLQQHQLIARQHYVRGALAREEQRRRQVESALQRLRRERVSLAAAGGRGAGDAYYGATPSGRGAIVSPRLQAGVRGAGARGAGAAAIATPSRLLAKQQSASLPGRLLTLF